MHDKRDDYEPIIATRRTREPPREDTQPLWRIALALTGGLLVVVLLAWWWMGRAPSDDASATAQSESAASAVPPATEEVEQPLAPPARDAESRDEIAQQPVVPPPEAVSTPPSEQEAIPENTSEAVPTNETPAETPAPATPASVSVRFVSPDTQVQIELHRLIDTSPPLKIKAGDVVALAPGPYRVVASGTQLEPFEQEVTFDGEGPLAYSVELCAQRKYTRESLAGQVVEERTCASTPECESMFTVLGEYADQLVRDRAFRTQQCAKWRADAAPEGGWTLNINCGGATLATTCRIEIAEGACTFAEPRRSARGAACPHAELK